MAKMDELYNDINKYCNENNGWRHWFSASDWNANLEKNYGVACFTALVNAGKMEKCKGFGEKTFSYRLTPTGKVKEMIEEEQRQRQIENAKWTVEHYEQRVARIRENYEENIRLAEEAFRKQLEWEEENLENAKSLLNENKSVG